MHKLSLVTLVFLELERCSLETGRVTDRASPSSAGGLCTLGWRFGYAHACFIDIMIPYAREAFSG